MSSQSYLSERAADAGPKPKTTNTITPMKFIIADNQDITRIGLHSVIERMSGQHTAIDAKDKRELVTHLGESDDCAVILDYTLFNINSIEDFFILTDRFARTKWIVFSEDLSENFIRNATVHDNIGILLKECSVEEIQSALRCAADGQKFLCHQVVSMLIETDKLANDANPLTPTEVEVLKLIAHGMTVKEIAAKRTSSVHTITTHKKNIFRKLGVNNVYEATKYALRAGLVEMMEYYI